MWILSPIQTDKIDVWTGTLLAGLKLGDRAGTKISENVPSNLVIPEETLSRTGVMVSKLGIGCAPFGDKHVDADDVA